MARDELMGESQLGWHALMPKDGNQKDKANPTLLNIEGVEALVPKLF